MKKIDWFQLLTIILIAELVGVLGSLLSGNTGEIYTSLIKPPLSPPGWRRRRLACTLSSDGYCSISHLPGTANT